MLMTKKQAEAERAMEKMISIYEEWKNDRTITKAEAFDDMTECICRYREETDEEI